MLVASFMAFGASTLNLFYLLHANVELLLTHGWLAVMEGGLLQSLELVGTALLGMAAYIVFKSCEHRLVAWLTDKETP